MTRHCPFCEAPITDEQLASVPMPMCPVCQSSLPVEFWSPVQPGGSGSSAGESLIEDEISVDFEVMETSNDGDADPDRIEELNVDWLNEVTADTEPRNTDDLATVLPTHLRNEFQLGTDSDAFEKPFELESAENENLDTEDSALPEIEEFSLAALDASPPAAPPIEVAVTESSVENKTNIQGRTGSKNSKRDSMERTDASNAGHDNAVVSARPRKGIVARLVSGLLLAGGLIASLCVLQLLTWWVLRMDPLQTALMLPKSVAWLCPYSLTEEGQRIAMQTKIRPTTGPEITEEEAETITPSAENSELPASEPSLADSPSESESAGTDEVAQEVPGTPQDANALDLASRPPTQVPPLEPAADADDNLNPDANRVADEESAEKATDAPQEPPSLPEDESATDGNALGATAEPPAETTQDDSMDDLLNDLNSVVDETADGTSAGAQGEILKTVEPPVPPLITNVPVFQLADLRQALSAAERATDDLNDAKLQQVDTARLTRIARDFYTALSHLAETATLVDANVADSEVAHVRTLLANLAQDAKKTRMIGTTAGGWIDRKLGNGVIVSGTIEEVNPVGRFQEIVLRPAGGDATMMIVTSEPDDSTQQLLTVGQNVLLGGYIIRDPESQLPSFLGSDPTVIWLHDIIVETP